MAWEVEMLNGGAKALVRVEGVVDSTNVEEFFAFINSIFKKGVKRMVLDMENTSYLSSGGISVIVDAYKKAEREGGRLVIARASDMVVDLFRVAQIERIIPLFSTLEEALQAL
ncbi:STAS domain-containing protein [Candidatus Solincola tengchongensis]|uniref:STAS domain-containing protein n=1 Tax=Candidatus Solincola tengchongensis TaxID=2900693 RepID=UPI0025796793|nr:STAS domain-containing protein [Candidatus Solincola tengchongensis]